MQALPSAVMGRMDTGAAPVAAHSRAPLTAYLTSETEFRVEIGIAVARESHRCVFQGPFGTAEAAGSTDLTPSPSPARERGVPWEMRDSIRGS